MAIILEDKYPGKVDPSDSEYPHGKARNITVQGDGTGTPWEAALVNDIFGFLQGLLVAGNITPTGSEDTAISSQYRDTLTIVDSVSVTDLDDVTGNRIFTFSNSAANAPAGGAYDAVGWQNSFSGQTTQYVTISGGNGNRLYIRTDDGGGFGSWAASVFDGETIESLTFSNEIRFEGASGDNALIQKNDASDRDELQIYSSGDAFGAGSVGAGIHVYGNSDIEHSGNLAIMTGQDGQGDGRIIVSGGSSNLSSGGYRTNTDTRVTIGNGIWNFVDDIEDTGMLNLRNPIGRPAIHISGASAAEGDITCEDGEKITLGHWDRFTETLTARMEMTPSGNWSPFVDTEGSIGSGSFRWDVIYASSGTINTSDEREKTQISNLSDAERAAAQEIKESLGGFKFLKSIDEKGDNARIHWGAGAQTVSKILEKNGLLPDNYAFLCYDEWEDQYDRVQANKGDKIKVDVQVPKTEIVNTESAEVFLENGRYVRKMTTKKEARPIVEVHNLYDEQGNVIGKHSVRVTVSKTVERDAEPVFEERLRVAAGSRYGLRYEELLCFIVSAL